MTIVFLLIWLLGSVLSYFYFRYLTKKQWPRLRYTLFDILTGWALSLIGSWLTLIIIHTCYRYR